MNKLIFHLSLYFSLNNKLPNLKKKKPNIYKFIETLTNKTRNRNHQEVRKWNTKKTQRGQRNKT